MKKVLMALSLTLFVGTVATANYSVTDPVKTEKADKGKKDKKKKSKKGSCCAAKTTETSSCCKKKD